MTPNHSSHSSAPITLAEDRLHVLLVRHREGGVARRVAIDRLPFAVGSAANADLVLSSATVSRRHASFSWFGDRGLVVKDEGSRNGLRVNGEVTAERLVRPGDVVKVGPFLIEVQVVHLGGHNTTDATVHED